ncbi:unnamed protein product (macronuclear) [Paramecium tetraurelia]|uniref:Jacalin-type lectin domain-containing protein n=1 Tax=Paramecium tetraurelia TaxID=5888 RepID=A0BNK2_PARTE|nr:uncharacterized protein GSPATT00030757001 [Paramecium tetraurelia]CAK60119.1 unnamed protein product [Paramecium tetraurelia]|eukprot:XP_001427517.1 hypothetical protein (macronuclear) [Paramecium tetraurelia strain d4-2]
MKMYKVEKYASGGGSYDEGGGNIKIGMWVEWQKIYINHFNNYITYNGEYKNGQKVGRWEICLIQFNKESNNWKKCVSGGGSYDEVRGLKIGKWVEIVSEISQIGEYLNGKKVGIWKDIDNENKLIACVFYGFGGFELNRSMTYYSYLLEIGNIQNGKKVGKWEIWSRNNEFMGGGSYDEGGLKIGRWIDLDKVNSYKQKNIGLYKYGKKVGQWDSWLLHGDKLNMKIGGGSYDEEGHEIKFGMWIELDEIFIYQNFRYITQKGEYKNGYKVGRWDINLIQFENKHNKRIGGGFYDQEGYGKKIGQWIELDEKKKFILNGEYKNGYKVGRWDISLIQCDNERNKLMQKIQILSFENVLVVEDHMMKEVMKQRLGSGFRYLKIKAGTISKQLRMVNIIMIKKVGIWVEVKIKRNNQYMKVKKIIICGN